MTKSILAALIASALCAATASSHADRADTQLNAELDVGLEYDSNLSVEELDRSSNEGDTSTLVRAKLNGQWGASDDLTLKGGYSYLGKNYRDNSAFDLAIHQLFADASYDLSLVTLGASHFLAMAELDGEDFLDLNQSSLYASKLFDKRIFVRVAADFRDKDFDNSPERNADNQGLGADVYFFFNNARSYVSLGLSGEQEDARAAELNYDGINFKSQLSNKFKLLERESKLVLGYQYMDRDYDNTDPLIGTARGDQRHATKLDWEVELMPHLAVVSTLEYRDYNSNLDSADYSESLASIALRLKL